MGKGRKRYRFAVRAGLYFLGIYSKRTMTKELRHVNPIIGRSGTSPSSKKIFTISKSKLLCLV